MVRKIALATLMAFCMTVGQAHAGPHFTPEKRAEFCRYASRDHRRGLNDGEVRSLIACVVRHYPVEGGLSKALYIAERESGFYCKAQNPVSSARGLFQILEGTWASWWSAIHPAVARWHLSDNRGLCRANAVIAIVAAHRYGWGPWSA